MNEKYRYSNKTLIVLIIAGLGAINYGIKEYINREVISVDVTIAVFFILIGIVSIVFTLYKWSYFIKIDEENIIIRGNKFIPWKEISSLDLTSSKFSKPDSDAGSEILVITYNNLDVERKVKISGKIDNYEYLKNQIVKEAEKYQPNIGKFMSLTM